MSEEDDVLSQEEIDALMDDDDDDVDEQADSSVELTEDEKDVLGEFGNIAMGSAATALYTLLDQKVEITAPEVEVISFGDLSQEYKKPCVMVQVEYLEGLEGMNLLIIDEKDARIIGDLMMGGDGTDPAEELDEIHLSAIEEAMNQMMGSASTAMSSIVDSMVNISPPDLEHLEIDDVINDEDKPFSDNDKVAAISFQLKIGDLIDSSFKQIAPLDFTQRLVSRLSGTGDGLTAKEESVEEDSEKVEAETQQPEKQTEVEQSSRETGKKTPEKEEPEPVEAKAEAQAGSTDSSQSIEPSSRNVSKKDQEEVDVKSAQFPNFDDNGEMEAIPKNMELIKDVPLRVTVRLGKSKMTIQEILDLGEGSIIELDKLAGEPVELLINGKLVAKGEVVVIDENFGFRVKDIINPMERLNNI